MRAARELTPALSHRVYTAAGDAISWLCDLMALCAVGQSSMPTGDYSHSEWPFKDLTSWHAGDSLARHSFIGDNSRCIPCAPKSHLITQLTIIITNTNRPLAWLHVAAKRTLFFRPNKQTRPNADYPLSLCFFFRFYNRIAVQLYAEGATLIPVPSAQRQDLRQDIQRHP